MKYQEIRNKLKYYRKIGILNKSFSLKQKSEILENKLNDLNKKSQIIKSSLKIRNFIKKNKPTKKDYHIKIKYKLTEVRGKTKFERDNTIVKSYKAHTKKGALNHLQQDYKNKLLFNDEMENSIGYIENGELLETEVMDNNQYNNSMLTKLDQPMKAAKVYQPEYLKHCRSISNDSYNDYNNECVYELLLNYYKDDIKTLTKEKIFNSFNKVYNIEYNMILIDGNKVNPYYDFNYKSGVSSKMIYQFCVDYDISCWGFDETDQNFLNYMSKSRHYKPLLYYCTNGHFYLIDDKQTIDFLRKSISNKKIHNDFTIKESKPNDEYDNIYYNLTLDEVLELKKGVVIYDEIDLRYQLIDYIKKFNKIPFKVVNRNYGAVSKIYINNLVRLEITNSLIDNIERDDIIKICNDNELKFKNQSFGAVVYEVKEKYYNKRKYLNDDEKKTILNKSNNKCNICKGKFKRYEFDHIEPFIKNYNNNLSNFQALCRDCHLEKSKKELDEGEYITFDNQKSYYNSKTKVSRKRVF